MLDSQKLRRRICRTILALLTIATILAVVTWTEQRRHPDDEYAVYSAYLSEGISNDAHDWSVDTPIQVVIEDTTKMDGNLRFRTLYVLHNRMNFDQLHLSTRVSFLARNLHQIRILPKFALPSRATVVLASKSEIQSLSNGSPESEKEFPNSAGLVALSRVGFSLSRTQAVFYIDHYCGLCGGGRYVLMEKVNGSWHIKGEHYTWIS
jgi:hypothetical protein